MVRARLEVSTWQLFALLAGGLLLAVPGCVKQDPAPPPRPAAPQVVSGDQDKEDPAPGENSPLSRPTRPTREWPGNRLGEERSPYLQSHMHDGVDWYPWGEEALAKAREENKPILLVIGYASSDLDQVMQWETFYDAEIAEYMSEHFVCVLVDRQERPDIDKMGVAAMPNFAMSRGLYGRDELWPIALFLTPEGLPFAGTTYLPPRVGNAERPTFFGFLKTGEEMWRQDEQGLRDGANWVASRIRGTLHEEGTFPTFFIGPDMVRRAVSDMAVSYDPEYGGFLYNPNNPDQDRYPTFPYLSLLVREGGQGDTQSLAMLINSLSQMARGGIHDQVGGGFHRASSDRYWRIPLFEKLLYTNAQAATIYTQAYELTSDTTYREVIEGTCDFVLRELAAPQGGFYAGLAAADTEGVDGAYYRWSQEELAEVLSPEDLEMAAAIYGLGGEPNFGEHYLPVVPKPLGETAADLELTEAELRERKAAIDEQLFAARGEREMPRVDPLILTDWNGLMIRALVEAGQALQEPAYTEAAAQAADFLLTHCRDDQGRLWHAYAEGEAYVPGFLDDYAFLVDGLLALHEATGEERWLIAADELTAKQIELFYDHEFGGFFFTSPEHEELVGRAKVFAERPQPPGLPAGNSLSVGNLVYLAEALERDDYLQTAGETVHASGLVMNFSPLDATRMLVEALGWKEAVAPEAEKLESQPAAGAEQEVVELELPAGSQDE